MSKERVEYIQFGLELRYSIELIPHIVHATCLYGSSSLQTWIWLAESRLGISYKKENRDRKNNYGNTKQRRG
jgi:hypothetical protein